MYRSATEKSILRDRNFWKGAGMFFAGCITMGLASDYATTAWFGRNEHARAPVVRDGDELGPDKALALWQGFPVTAQPRPLVIVGPDYRPPAFGESNRDTAFRLGRWTVPMRLPLPPHSSDGYGIRYVGAALQELRDQLEQSADPKSVDAGLTLGTAEERAARPQVVGAKLQRASFTTDRGVRSLPAWVVNFRGQERPLVLLAVKEPARFALRTPQAGRSRLSVSPDGLDLTYTFFGPPEGRERCEAEYEPIVRESPTAVAVGAKAYFVGARDAACGPENVRRTVTAHLDAPLGERVAVTALDGAPLAPLPQRAVKS